MSRPEPQDAQVPVVPLRFGPRPLTAARPRLVAVASGKGGVGKSTSVANLALLLARGGKSVVVVDLDVGGADMHVMFGELSPPRTLSDFVERRVPSLEDVAFPIPWCQGLRLIAGTGDTLRNTNPAAAIKKKLERHVRSLHADVVLIDIGAGTNYHALDFFLWADAPIVVATPDPTSVLDLYKFVKLAAVRRVANVLGAKSSVSAQVSEQDMGSLEQLLDVAKQAGPETEAQVAEALRAFRPNILFNGVVAGGRASMGKLTAVIRQFLGSQATILGEIPEDPALKRSVRSFLPVVEADPLSPSARAFALAASKLRAQLV